MEKIKQIFKHKTGRRSRGTACLRVVVARNLVNIRRHSTIGYYNYYYTRPSSFRPPRARSLSHFLPLPLARTFPPNEGLVLLAQSFLLRPARRLSRRGSPRLDGGTESLSSCCNGGGIPKHGRADALQSCERQRKREREVYRTRPHSTTLAILCDSPRGSNRIPAITIALRPIVPVCAVGSLPRRVPFGYKLPSRSQPLDGNVIERYDG